MSAIGFVVNGQTRFVERALWDTLLGDKPAPGYACNGCTASPDIWRGIRVWIACVIHDWHYDANGPDVPRVLADLYFRLNIWRVARFDGAPAWRAAYVALAYHTGVVVGGAPAYKRARP